MAVARIDPSPIGATATSPARRCDHNFDFDLRYDSMSSCQSRWSGARLSQADPTQRKVSVNVSRKLEHSTAKQSKSPSNAEINGVSVLPTATLRRPARLRMALAINVVVVLPSVPVMPTIGRAPLGRFCSQRYASSISESTSIPRRRASTMTSCDSGTPGAGSSISTSSSTAAIRCTEPRSPSPSDSMRNESRSAKSRCSLVTRSSASLGFSPRCTSARVTALPAIPSPKTRAVTADAPVA